MHRLLCLAPSPKANRSRGDKIESVPSATITLDRYHERPRVFAQRTAHKRRQSDICGYAFRGYRKVRLPLILGVLCFRAMVRETMKMGPHVFKMARLTSQRSKHTTEKRHAWCLALGCETAPPAKSESLQRTRMRIACAFTLSIRITRMHERTSQCK